MPLRSLIKFVLVPLIFCAIFWKPIALTGIGAAAKVYLYSKKGWKIGYSSIEWSEKGLIFADFSLIEQKGFSIKAEKAIASMKEKRIEIVAPRVLVHVDAKWKSEPSEWKIAMQDGTIEGEGIAPASFSLETGLSSHFHLAWEQGWVRIDANPNESGHVAKAELKGVNPLYFERWFGNRLKGSFDGSIEFQSKGGEWVWSEGWLGGKELSYDGVCSGIEGMLKWESPLIKSLALNEGRFRLAVAKGRIDLSGAEVKDLKGDASFLGKLGAKWEFSGDLMGDPLLLAGKGVFESLQQDWAETEIRYQNGSFRVEGREESKGRFWTFGAESLPEPAARLLWNALRLYMDQISEWSWLKGSVSGQGALLETDGEIQEWALSSFAGNNLQLESPSLSFGVEKVQTDGDAFSVEDGSFSFRALGNLAIQGSNWNGEGKISEEKGRFFGRFADHGLCLELKGNRNEFLLYAESKGAFTGDFFLNGNWDGETLGLQVDDGQFDGVKFSGKGMIDTSGMFSWQSERFSGPVEPIIKLIGQESLVKGWIEAYGNGLTVEGSLFTPETLSWALQARLEDGEISLFSTMKLENLSLEFGADERGLSCYGAKGIFSWGNKFPFYCPIFETNGVFDLRLEGETWDFARFAGRSDDGEIVLDELKSHLFGAPVRFGNCLMVDGEMENLYLDFDLPWKSIASFFQMPDRIDGLPVEGGVAFGVVYEKERGAEIHLTEDSLLWGGEPIALDCLLKQEGSEWRLEPSKIADFSLEGIFFWSENALRLSGGRAAWREGLKTEIKGSFDSMDKWSVQLTDLSADIASVSLLTSRFGWPLEKIEGMLEGSGMVGFQGKLEADFDFSASKLKAGTLAIENRTPLHLYYSSEQGVLFRGLDLSVLKPELAMPWVDCKVGLLQYDVKKSRWILTHSHFNLPADFFNTLKNKPPFLEAIALQHSLDFIADIECSSDFSTLSCKMKEGFIPVLNEVRHIQNLRLFWDPDTCTAQFDLFYHSEPIKIGLAVDLEPKIAGRLSIQNELFIDWSYGDHFSIQSIEGKFPGIDASFHSEANGEYLIGSARLDFNILSEMIPPRIAQVFTDLEMGKGYEIMGRMKIQGGFSFQGILSGKSLELFGFQLRTLLAQVEITPEKVRIYDVKISDSAGVMKIDEILAAGVGEAPWTLSIPHIVIKELRPSLIQKVGGPPGEISPLVVRELKIDGFQGLLEESKTYTAKGELYFINSYKREHTLFDLPSDVLSRIVGLDLDLLIPVCGTLRYELKDGYFQLTELIGSYSENKRSEFFLVKSDASPRMDLDGNLSILISMKQFVLFKFTESFQISIEGKLDDPKFHLQKKKRFLGL